MKKLKELLVNIDIVEASGSLESDVTGVTCNSQKVRPGNCFVAVKGFKVDGIAYLREAIVLGAKAVITENPPDEAYKGRIIWVQVKDTRRALGRASAAFWNHPSERLEVIGVTGTNGKTTVAELLGRIHEEWHGCCVIGTLGVKSGARTSGTTLTTPESSDIQKFMGEAETDGKKSVVMEVSSVAIELRRVADISFNQGIFTSFSGDHLDFHGNMENYLNAKLKLLRGLGEEGWAIISSEVAEIDSVREALECRYLTYGFKEDADVRPFNLKMTVKGTEFSVNTPAGTFSVKTALIGRINVMNLLAVIASAVASGISFEVISRVLGEAKPVKGRLDCAWSDKFSVVVDYAHTDGAIEKLLISLKEIVKGRVILVFGAGGQKDKTKRPRMGKVAAECADYTVLTSDNPRKEKPEEIIEDIIKGFPEGFSNYSVEPDRYKGIAMALEMAEPGDCVAVAGKGHEDYQIFADKTIHFDDFEVIKECMEKIDG